MKCKHCGEEIANDSIYCEFCGEKVKQKNVKKLIIVGCISVLCVLGVAVIAYAIHSNNKENDLIDEVEETVLSDTTAVDTISEFFEVVADPHVPAQKIEYPMQKNAPQDLSSKTSSSKESNKNDNYSDAKPRIVELADNLSKTKILFDKDSDVPRIYDSNDNIDKTIQILKKNSSLKLIVEGYTPDTGSEEKDRDLAQRRANNVRDLFIKKGVDPAQIETATYTVNDPHNHQNLVDPEREEHNAAIFRIVKK